MIVDRARTRHAAQIATYYAADRSPACRFGVINNYETELLKKAATRALFM